MIRLGYFLVLGVVFLSSSAAADETPADSTAKTVFASDFSQGATEHWSNRKVDAAPKDGRKFLGQFSNEAVQLTLRNLPPHARVRVSFEIFIINSWDGGSPVHGPDTFSLRVAGGPRLVHATFCNNDRSDQTQSYPATHGVQEVGYRTGAAEVNTLGFRSVPTDGETIYRISRVFTHSGDALTLVFSAQNLEDISNESWGLDRVKVEVLSAPSDDAIDEQAIAAAWSELLVDDAVKADAACQLFAEAGAAGLAALAKLEEATGRDASNADRLEAIRKHIEALDADEFQARQRAYLALEEFGALALPELERALQGAPPLEKRLRIARLIDDHQSIRAPSETRRSLRFVDVLERIGTPEARERLTALANGALGPNLANYAKASLLRLDGRG